MTALPAPAGAALRRCVALDLREFARTHWGRAPLLSRAGDLEAAGVDPGFDDLLGVDDVDELLSRRGLRTPFLRVAKDGEVLPASRFTGSGGAGAEIGDQVLDERVFDLYADGATLVLQGLHRVWPPLVDFTGRLAAELVAPVQANAYLTPAGNRGFDAHYDTHDVFVLQVAGRKRWRVHEPVRSDPLERQPWGGRVDEVGAVAAGQPVLDVVLEAGDALYLPRGWVHAADALGHRCLHLTLGLRTPTRYTLVEALLALAVEEPELRSGFPLGLDVTDPEALAPQLQATANALREWLARADASTVATKLAASVWPASRPAPMRPLAQAAALDGLDADTVIAPRRGLRWRIDPSGADRVALRLADRTVSFPAGCEPAVRALLTSASIAVRDLPGLDSHDALVLARRLLREAIAVPAERP
ncbi:MAG TPA: cupin domain-containing protein [Micromonosporaceae bacterium]|jgi:ribosomal protein L16 Arg81 hydroxylase